jgi:hypothetical protein
MKRVLLDENLDQRAYQLFPEYLTRTVGYMKWSGISNGKLLTVANEQFDVLITADQNIPYQQSLAGKTISVLVIPSGRLDRIMKMLGTIKSGIDDIGTASFSIIKPDEN